MHELADVAKVMGGRVSRRVVFEADAIRDRVREMGAEIT